MKAVQPYRDRREAGQILAAHVQRKIPGEDAAVVLALARGGVPVGFEVAHTLGSPLDVFVVRKLGVPSHPELAMGAIADNGYELLNENLIAELGLSRLQIAAVADRETEELHRRADAYRAHRPAVDVHGRTAILVDDGLATGFSMRAAIGALRLNEISGVIVAVPVGAAETVKEIEREVDAVICPLQPDPFYAVGMWYEDFAPTSDEEVQECLSAAQSHS